MLIKIIIWLAFLYIPVSGYLSYRFMPFRSQRYNIYLIILIVSAILNLNHISFYSDTADIVVCWIITFFICEFFFFFNSFIHGKFSLFILVFGLAVYSLWNFEWIREGPSVVEDIFKTGIVSSFEVKEKRYYLKESYIEKSGKIKREIVLMKETGLSFFEKKIKNYVIPSAYNNSEFSMEWSVDKNRASVNLWVDGYILWTIQGNP